MRKIHDWAKVQQFYDGGNEATRCRERFAITYGAWAGAIRRGKLRVKPSAYPRRYDWHAVQAYYNEGHSHRQCMRHFGVCSAAWQKAVRRGEIKPRPSARPLEEILANGNSRTNIKQRLVRAGLLENRCGECGLVEWLGEHLTIQIDRINGTRNDHRLENLRMLCPNCHSQTDTYGKRNAKRGRLQERGASV
jgi:5-methylcytosine-specific restriction endonuclease McrA